MFREMITPNFMSARICVNSLWYNVPTMLPVAGSLEAEASRIPATDNIVGTLYHNL